MHVAQFALEDGDPHIAFEERKNGPGTVNIVYGLDTLETRIAQIAGADGWDGYLFPSSRSSTGHVDRTRTNA